MTSASERRPMDQSEIAAANVEDESKDWINQLPNCILESVVSLLNLRDAVRTSMVSPRWRYLWLNSTVLKRRNIELDIQNIFGSKHVGPKFQLVEDYFTRFMEHFDRRVFINRVNRFLELHHGEKIDAFKVTFFLGVESSDVLDQWIRFAFTKGVEDLCLHLFPDLCYVNWDDYVFPSWLLSELNSSTLKCLSLRRCKLGPPPDMHKFSQLTALHLYSVCVDRVFMEQLFSVCLLLESFTLNGSSLVGGTLTVVGPTLRLNDLKVIECRNLFSLNIDTVNLASLELIAKRLFNVSLKAPQLIKSSLVITQAKEIARAVPVIASCPALETLHLAMHLDFPIGTPPTFRNLKLLALDVHTELCRRDINLGPVLNLLRVTPVLEELVLTILYGPKTYAKKGKIDNHSGFTHDSLKKVTVQGFQGHSYEMEFLICVLENATKLETMAIESFGKFYKGDGIWEKVMNLNASAWTKQRRKVLVELMLQEKLKDVRTSTRIVVL